MRTEKNYDIVEAMETYGGSFVQALAKCFLHADYQNFSKLKKAFPEYWNEYAEMAQKQNETTLRKKQRQSL